VGHGDAKGCGSGDEPDAALPSRREVMNDLTVIAIRLARECRIIIQACLREEEWDDAEEEFRWVILAGLHEAKGARHDG
jgi:hypothetical protein